MDESETGVASIALYAWGLLLLRWALRQIVARRG